ncbi:MAG: pyridoxal-phosphate dependent enzyme [Candidatus Hermodarchaeota archaeon]
MIELKKLIGNTTFIEVKNLANLIGVERLYLKFEGSNPTGTQKDRIALALVEDAMKNGYKGIITATCGNFGAALAYVAKSFGLETYIYIPTIYHPSKNRINYIKQANAHMLYVDGHYEDAVEFSSEIAENENYYNANPGTDRVKELSFKAYGEISMELYRSLRRVPDYVFCPVGNGTTLTGIHLGFKQLYKDGKISKIPKIVATSTTKGNPVIKSYKSKSKTALDLSPDEIKESKINEPLINWHSYDGQEALDAIYESDGFAEYASDTRMMNFAKILREEQGVNALPASTSTLAVLSSLKNEKVTLKGTYVSIITGRYFK